MSIEPYLFDIENLPADRDHFLQSKQFIVNIPSKNIDAFLNLIKEIEKSPIEEVIFVSSTSVYRDNNKTVYESDNGEILQGPLYRIEEMFRSSKTFKTTIVRFGGLIGYSRNPGKFFKSDAIIKNPDGKVNLIHRDDCIGIILEILKKKAWGEVFNCCADSHPTRRAFYTQALHAIGRSTPTFAESSEASYKIISNQKVKDVLQYSFVHPDVMEITYTSPSKI